jgi:hypothetical protein
MRRFLVSIPARGVVLRHNGPLSNFCRVGQITTAPRCVSCNTHSVTRKRIFQKSFHNSTVRYSNGYSTIYALSTAPGRAAIAVIRISGPACLQVRISYLSIGYSKGVLTFSFLLRYIVHCAPERETPSPGLRLCEHCTIRRRRRRKTRF